MHVYVYTCMYVCMRNFSIYSSFPDSNLHSCKISGCKTKARAQPDCQASLLLKYWGMVEELRMVGER